MSYFVVTQASSTCSPVLLTFNRSPTSQAGLTIGLTDTNGPCQGTTPLCCTASIMGTTTSPIEMDVTE